MKVKFNFDLLLYFMPTATTNGHVRTVSYPSHTVPGQASQRQGTSI